MRLHLFVATAALVLSTGCGDGPELSDPVALQAEPQLIGMHEYGIPYGELPTPPIPGDYPDISRNEFVYKSNLAGALSLGARAAAQHASGWRAADRALRDSLREGYRLALPPYLVEQAIATAMLRHSSVLSNPLDEDDEWRAVTEFYLSLLVRNNSPDAVLIEKALDVLEPHWNRSEWADAALSTSRARQSYDERLQRCATCSVSAGSGFAALPPGRSEPFLRAIAAYQERQLEAAQRLESQASAKRRS